MNVPIIRVTGPALQQTLNEVAFSTPVHHHLERGRLCARDGEGENERESGRETEREFCKNQVDSRKQCH